MKRCADTRALPRTRAWDGGPRGVRDSPAKPGGVCPRAPCSVTCQPQTEPNHFVTELRGSRSRDQEDPSERPRRVSEGRQPHENPTHLATARSTWGSCSHFFRASTLLVFLWGLASRKTASDHRTPGIGHRDTHVSSQTHPSTRRLPREGPAKENSNLGCPQTCSGESHKGRTCPPCLLAPGTTAAPVARSGEPSGATGLAVPTTFKVSFPDSVILHLRIYWNKMIRSANKDADGKTIIKLTSGQNRATGKQSTSGTFTRRSPQSHRNSYVFKKPTIPENSQKIFSLKKRHRTKEPV